MTSLILLNPTIPYEVTLELVDGKKIAIDLLPLKSFLEKLFDENNCLSQIQETVKLLLIELSKSSLELAEHVASFMLAILKNVSIQRGICHPSS